MGMPEDVHPFPIFFAPEIRPDDDALFRITTFQLNVGRDASPPCKSACKVFHVVINLD